MDIIEYLRAKMIREAETYGKLTHPKVVAVSQQLDRFLIQVQRNRYASRTFVNAKVSREERRSVKIIKNGNFKIFASRYSNRRYSKASRNL